MNVNDIVKADAANTDSRLLWRVVRITPDRVVELVRTDDEESSFLIQESNLVGKTVFRETLFIEHETAAEARSREFSTFFDFNSFGADARKWARAFTSRFKLQAPDEVIMLSWFSCAIAAGKEHASKIEFNADPDNLDRFSKTAAGAQA